MLKNYLRIALRNLIKNKGFSFINIGGLAIGMAVAMLIGLWIHDELAFNQNHRNYDRIAQVKVHSKWRGEVNTNDTHVTGLGALLRSTYNSHFKHVVMVRETAEYIIASEDKAFTELGNFMQPEAPEMLTLKMVYGAWSGLRDMSSILLSRTLAEKFFGDANPLGKILKINARMEVKVTGVFEDLPHNSEFSETAFIAPFDLMVASYRHINANAWTNYNMLIYVQIHPRADFDKVSAIIKNAELPYVDKERAAANPEVFLHPMRKWHLHSTFENGVNVTSERMKFVWFYGMIGVFVLLLACINFMNLSTAGSAKRAKEIGVRKSVGSMRSQLVGRFLSESVLTAVLAFVLALSLVQLILPWFNELANKEMGILWTNPWYWLAGTAFTLFTALLAGSYPAFYLASFNPVTALKGAFRSGRDAAFRRKILVVVQFTVCTALIIGTMAVYQQIQFAKNRPAGYSRDGLLMLPLRTPDGAGKYHQLRSELKRTGVVAEIAESERSITSTSGWNAGFNWQGKDPAFDPAFNTVAVTHEFGKTVGWQFVAGRDFSRDFASDLSGVALNESAVKLMGLENPVGKIINFDPPWQESRNYAILGVVKDIVKGSPFQPAYPSVTFLSEDDLRWLYIKIAPDIRAGEALPKIEAVLKKLAPSIPFDYKFADDAYAARFYDEERIGKLAGFFSALAILISCLGLFGLVSFVAEQRTKEIGVRKILGASVANLWRMLCKDFVALVMISCFIAVPVAYFFLHAWLQKYEYRTEISWWVFATASIGVLFLTLLTVSFQAVKAAIANPVDSLRSE
jgi:ABC-type antimicrobial peptide transport system permease subunit